MSNYNDLFPKKRDEFKILDEKLPLQVVKRVYSLECHRIEVFYRCYDEGCISNQISVLDKHDKSVKSDNDYVQLEESFESILNFEKETILALRQLHQHAVEYYTSRIRDENILLGV